MRPIATALAIVFALSTPAFSQEVIQQQDDVVDLSAISAVSAEEIISQADVAIYFPASQRLRFMTSADARQAEEFVGTLERDYPSFRRNAFGPYVLKRPSVALPLPSSEGAVARDTAVRPSMVRPNAAGIVFTDSFEAGLSQWKLGDDSGGKYDFAASGCGVHSGIWGADTVRAGTSGQYLFCSDPYPKSVTTQIAHSSCEAIQGASQAWLDFYFTADMDTNDTLGVYYLASDGYLYGYSFSASWTGWYHVVLNLKQWNRLGDLTAQSCPKAYFQFISGATNTTHAGTRIDDVTIRTDAPAFLKAGINATPTSGAAPLTVNFSPSISGSAGGETYQWSFGDAASSTATTQNATFVYTTPGTYWARLRVIDSAATRSYAQVQISATSPSPCTLTCSATVPSTGTAGSAVAFAATATATSCSSSPAYSWTFGDNQTSAAQNPSHTYAAAGTYNWTLTVIAGGTSCSKSGSITIAAAAAKTVRRRVVLPPTDSTTLATQPIGATGGTVSGGGYTLTVPSGAFANSTTITLTKINTQRQPGDLSATFGVGGLPNTLSADLSISVDLDAAPPALGPADAIYLSFGGLALNHDAGTITSVPFLIPATVSGRTVKATLPKNWASPSLASAAAGRVTILASKDPRHESTVVIRTSVTNDHFIVDTDTTHVAWAQSALTTLESAYQRLGTLGFNWGCRQPSGGAFVKIPVYVESLGPTDYGDHNSRLDPCGTGWVFTDYIALNSDIDVADPTMRASIGHELFHFLQEMYVPTTLTDPSRALWIAEASSVWFETIFVPGSCPGVMTGDYQFPWNGFFNPSGSAVEGTGRRQLQNHGYGAAALLKYHSDRAGVQNDPFVNSIWSNLKSGNGDIASFTSAMPGSASNYWNAFSTDFFTQRTDCSPGAVDAGKAAMTDASTLVQSFRVSAYPFSSISFVLDLQQLTITDKTPLPINASGLTDQQTIHVYDVKSRSELGQITKNASTYTIADITALRGSKVILVFVDGSLPLGSAASTGNVTITTGSQYTQLSIGSTRYNLLCIPGHDCSGESCGVNLDGGFSSYMSPVSWNGSAFQYSNQSSTLSGQLSADQKTLVSFAYKAGGAVLLQWANVPVDMTRTTTDTLVFAISGNAARDHIIVANPFICSNFSGVDYSKPVQIELWLAR